MRRLFTVRQGQKESIPAFVIKFRGAALESGVEERRLKEAFVDALLSHWQMQARSLLATTLGMSSSQLIQMLCVIAGPRRTDGSAMKIGKQEVEEDYIDMEAVQVQENGRILMPANFGSMRELLRTLDEAIPHNSFLRNWLRNKVQKDQGGNMGRMSGRGRGGYSGHGGQQFGGQRMRFCEAELDEYPKEYVEEIEVGL